MGDFLRHVTAAARVMLGRLASGRRRRLALGVALLLLGLVATWALRAQARMPS